MGSWIKQSNRLKLTIQPKAYPSVQPRTLASSITTTPIHSLLLTRARPKTPFIPSSGLDRHGRRAGLPRCAVLLPRRWRPPPCLRFPFAADPHPRASLRRSWSLHRLRLVLRRGLLAGALRAHHAALLRQRSAAYGKRLHHHRSGRHRPLPGKPPPTIATPIFSTNS